MNSLEILILLAVIAIIILYISGFNFYLSHGHNWLTKNISNPINKFLSATFFLIFGIVIFYIFVRILHFFWITDFNTLFSMIDNY